MIASVFLLAPCFAPALFFVPAIFAAPSPTVTLDSLEAQIGDSPDLRAQQSTVEAKLQALRESEDAAGLGYLYENTFGPASELVPRSYNDFIVRFDQGGGVTLPLLGTAIGQRLAIVDAAEQVQLAKISLEQTRRSKLAALRKAYVEYWSLGEQARIADAYVRDSRRDIAKARSLRSNGFFTFTDQLDVTSSVDKVRFDAESLENLQRSQLALVSSALGREVARFAPSAPSFFDGCVPHRAEALRSAYDVDASLAQIEARTVEVREQLANVKGSSIAATAVGEIGSTTDFNHRDITGYRVDAGLNVNFPTHARDEERARRAQDEAALSALAFDEQQRRVEIEATVDAALDDVRSAQDLVDQANGDERARDKDFRTAQAAFALLRQTPAQFLTVHARRTDLLAAESAAAVETMDLLLQVTDLLAIAPAACGGPVEAEPPFVLPPAIAKPTAAPRPTG